MLAHVEQELDPHLLSPLGKAGCLSHLQGTDCLSPFSPEEVLPFSYQPGHWRFSLVEAYNGPGQCSGHSQAPTQNLWPLKSVR
jgi:hypothetical protein